ncbi:MAG: hypothetical protein R2865_17005 [Deinococcales bacterium]
MLEIPIAHFNDVYQIQPVGNGACEWGSLAMATLINDMEARHGQRPWCSLIGDALSLHFFQPSIRANR